MRFPYLKHWYTDVFFYSISYIIKYISLLASLPRNSPLNFVVTWAFLHLRSLVRFLSPPCLAFIVLISQCSTVAHFNLSWKQARYDGWLNSKNLRILLDTHDAHQDTEILWSSAWALWTNSLHLNYHQELIQRIISFPRGLFFSKLHYIHIKHYNVILHTYHIFSTQDNILNGT